jgi:hypothetical protein
MCAKCRARDLIVRIERQAKAADKGGNFNPETVVEIMREAAGLLAIFIAADELAGQVFLAG